MNASDIIRLLNSNHYAPAELDEVNKLCRDFPEFSTAHLLKVRIMEALGYEKQKQLKLAAVYSMNRKKLHLLVTEVNQLAEKETEPEAPADGPELIQFSEENNEHADVIIEQHAPYAGVEPAADLLELDEDPASELLELDMEPDEEAEEAALDLSHEEALDLSHEEALDLTVAKLGLVTVEKRKEEAVEEEANGQASQADEPPPVEQPEPKKEKKDNHLITRFIKGEPGPIRADKETDLKGDVSLASIREHDGFITDTLAQIYVKQGLFAKAIYAYEKLSLKYPEKSAYFAAQIEKIRNINHS